MGGKTEWPGKGGAHEPVLLGIPKDGDTMKNTGDRGSRAGEKQSPSEMSVTVHAPEAPEGDECLSFTGEQGFVPKSL